MSTINLEIELEKCFEKGREVGILQSRLAIANWLLTAKDFLPTRDLAQHVLSMPICEEDKES